MTRKLQGQYVPISRAGEKAKALTMVVDTSALIGILLGEPETASFVRALADDPKKWMSAFNALESAIVIEAKKGEAGGRELNLLLHRAQIEIVALNADQAELARAAWRKYGMRNRAAGLNIGDCCAYALAKSSGEPLLFKGEGFGCTDVQRVAAV